MKAVVWLVFFLVVFLFCSTYVQAEAENCKLEDKDRCGPGENCVKRGLDNYQCVCKTGYKKQDSACKDVDECKQKDLRLRCQNKGAKCLNLPGSYECKCLKGFYMDPFTHRCEDVDECDNGLCHEMAYCENTKGSYSCACKTGFAGDGHECVEDVALKHKKTAQMAILIGGAGGGGLALIIAVVTFVCCAKRNKKKPVKEDARVEASYSEYGQGWESSESDSDEEDDDDSDESD